MNFTKLRRYGIICLLVTLLISVWTLFSIGHIDVKRVLAIMQGEPQLAPIIFILVMVVSANLLLPLGLGLNLGAGIIWGGFLGGVWTTLGSLLAAIAGFLIARSFGGDYLRDYLRTKQAQLFLDSVKRHDLQIIFLIRLNPIVPFGLQNYLFGLSGIQLTRYSVLSLFSCAIPAFLYAGIGASINDLVLTGNLKSLLTIAGAVLLLVTIAYLAKLYFRKSSVSG